jgi:hypothetical protein
MRSARWAGIASLVAAVASAGEVGADPMATEPAVGYPASLAARPLLLPAGLYELTAQAAALSWGDGYYGDNGVQWGDLVLGDLGLRAGLGAIEVRGSAQLILLSSSDYYTDRVQQVGAGASLPLSREGALYADGELARPSGDYPGLGLHGGYAWRQQTTPGVAIEVRGGLGSSTWRPDGAESDTVFSFEGRAAVQGEMSSQWAGELALGLTLPVADTYEEDVGLSSTANLGARLLYTTPKLDAFVGLATVGGGIDEYRALAGLAARLP